MDIENNKCLLAYAKLIKDKYESGELIKYLYPRIDHFITYPYGQLRGFIINDKFQNKEIVWNCDGEDYYRLVLDDCEFNLDAMKEIEKIKSSDLSFFDPCGYSELDYSPDYEFLNYLLTFMVYHYDTVVKSYNPNSDTDSMEFYKFVDFTKKYFGDWDNNVLYFDDKIEIWDDEGVTVLVKKKKKKIVFKSGKYKIIIPTVKP